MKRVFAIYFVSVFALFQTSAATAKDAPVRVDDTFSATLIGAVYSKDKKVLGFKNLVYFKAINVGDKVTVCGAIVGAERIGLPTNLKKFLGRSRVMRANRTIKRNVSFFPEVYRYSRKSIQAMTVKQRKSIPFFDRIMITNTAIRKMGAISAACRHTKVPWLDEFQSKDFELVIPKTIWVEQ